MQEPIKLVIEERIAHVTLQRAQVRNAMDDGLAKALYAAVKAVTSDEAVRCVIICGEGGHFMAGGDVKFFHESLPRLREGAGGEFRELVRAAHGTVEAMHASDKLFVAAARGSVAGFGLSLLAACDIAIAGDDALFSLAYPGIGASPDGGVTWHLPRLVGMRRALGLALLNERFDALAAERMGLINCVVPAAELEARATELARRLAAGPAAALARTKHLLRSAMQRDLGTQLAAEEGCFRESLLSEDFAEGVAAFCEKRPPRW